MMRRALATAVLAAGLTIGAACSGDSGPQPGVVNFNLAGPAGARSAVFKVVGPDLAVPTAPAGVRVYADTLPGDTLLVVAVAQAGHTLQEQAMGGVAVPDVRTALGFTVIVVQVAGANYALQNPFAYSVSITQAP